MILKHFNDESDVKVENKPLGQRCVRISCEGETSVYLARDKQKLIYSWLIKRVCPNIRYEDINLINVSSKDKEGTRVTYDVFLKEEDTYKTLVKFFK